MKPLLDKVYQKRFWLFLLGIIIAKALFIVTYPMGLGITGICELFMLFISWCMIGSIVLLMISTTTIRFKAQRRILAEISFCAIVGCSLIIITYFTIGNLLLKKQIEGSKKNASIIIEALEKYRNEKGRYPEKLKELVPQYLTEIPKTKIKMPFFKDCEFDYSRGKNYYRLEFPAHAWTYYIYRSNTKEWEVEVE